jgi:anti-sigma B factor antagonist
VPYGPRVATVDELGEHLTGRELASPDGPVYALAGDLDMSATNALTDRLLAFGAEHGQVVTLDMGGVEFVDSSGLRCLTKVFGELASFGGELRIVDPSPAVLRVLRLVGVEDMFGIAPESEQA